LSQGDGLQSRRALLARPVALLPAPGALDVQTRPISFSRRRLLQTGGVAALLLSVPGLWRLRTSFFAGGVPAYLKRETYEPLVGSSFVATESRKRLQLVSVDGIGSGPDSFSLIFRIPPGAPPLGPVVHGLRHPRIGAIDLVLLPVGRAVHGQSYQSIVNRDRRVARKEAPSLGQQSVSR
jgi:uncharacterized protein DUF6916